MKKKSINLLCLLILASGLIIISCKKDNPTITPTGVSVSKDSITLVVASKDSITANISPSNATIKTVTWKSSNTAIATVSSLGIITGVGDGIANITATTTNGNLVATCVVTVIIPVTGITLSKSTLKLFTDSTFTLIATISPSNATHKTITWKSSNSAISTVSSTGVVKGISPGRDTITATIDNYKATCVCTVSTLTINDGMIAYYQFNGNTNDESGHNNNGTYHGRSAYTTDRNGVLNSALDLNGSSDYVEVPNSPSLNPTNQLTVSVWLSIASYPNRYTSFINKSGPLVDGFINREYLLYFNDQGATYVESSGDNQPRNYVGVMFPGLNNWFHFTVVFDRINHKIQLYINGVFKTEIADTYTNFTINNSPLEIGAWNEKNPEYAPFFNGKIDEVRMYNRALTPQEILSIYQL